MTPPELRARIDRFADGIITFCTDTAADPLRIRLLVQLQDSATSAAANYRAACRAQSKAAFVAKLSIALEEADESVGWLQRLSHLRAAPGSRQNDGMNRHDGGHRIGNHPITQSPDHQMRQSRMRRLTN